MYTLDRYNKPWYSALIEPHMLLFYLIFVWGAYLRFYTLTDPFTDDYHGYNAGYMCLIARNWIRHGLWNLKFYQVMDGGPLVAGSEIYTHHPPLVPMLVAFWFKISGSFSEWCARIVPITFSLGSLVLLYILVRRIWNERIALLASFCYAIVPYAAYFASDVCYETGDQFFYLMILYWYLRYMESQRFKHFAFMCVSLVIGALNDWPAFYTVPILGLHWFFRFPGKRRLYFLLYPALAAAMMGIFFWMIAKAEGTWMIREIAAVLDPRWSSPSWSHHTSLAHWLKVIILDCLFYFCTPVVMVLVSLWVGGFFFRWVRRKVAHQDIMLLILLSHGVMHVVLGRNWAYTHDYWSSVLMPGLSVAAAVVFHNLFNRLIRYGHAGWIWKGFLYSSLIAFGVFCTYRFYRVLEDRASIEGHRIAAILRENTEFEDHILTTWKIGEDLQTRFYADRNIAYWGITDLEQFVGIYETPYWGMSWAGGPHLESIKPRIAYGQSGPAYRYFFMPDVHKTRYATLYNFLKRVYRMRTVEDFIIFDLKDQLVSDEELSEILTAHNDDV